MSYWRLSVQLTFKQIDKHYISIYLGYNLDMERIKSINPDRIKWCCDDFRISLEELAKKLKIALNSLERVMDKTDGLTFNQLSNLAEYFGRSILFFLEDSPINDTSVHSPQFRTLANQKPEISPKLRKIIERAETQQQIYINLIEELEEPDLLNFNPPALPKNDIKTAANIVRKWLGLDKKNEFESYRTSLESKGILVFRSNGYAGKWQFEKEDTTLGFSLYDPVCPVIVVRKLYSNAPQSFTLMHELGHLLLHKSSSIDDDNDFHSLHGLEYEANAFAGNLLVPDGFLTNIPRIPVNINESEYKEFLKPFLDSWGVSTEVILRRLLSVGRLAQEQYSAYRNWHAKQIFVPREGGNRMYRHREPIHIFGDRFVRIVLDALSARYITLNKASSYLDNIEITDLHLLENKIASF